MATFPEKPLLNDTTKSLIVSPTGEAATYPTVMLSHEEAKLLRAYKVFLDRHHLKEALYCETCYEKNLHNGCRAFVTTDQILIQCRCQARFYNGATL